MVNAPKIQGGVLGKHGAVQCSTTLERINPRIQKQGERRAYSRITFKEVERTHRGFYSCRLIEKSSDQIVFVRLIDYHILGKVEVSISVIIIQLYH